MLNTRTQICKVYKPVVSETELFQEKIEYEYLKDALVALNIYNHTEYSSNSIDSMLVDQINYIGITTDKTIEKGYKVNNCEVLFALDDRRFRYLYLKDNDVQR